jgi:signal transduction histidine kinase
MIFSDKEFEKKFLTQYSKNSVLNFRISIFLGFITAMAFGFVDLWSLEKNYSFAIGLRFTFMGPALLGIVFWSFHKNFYKYLHIAVFWAGLASTLAIATIISKSDPSETAYDHYFAGIILVNVWIATYARFRFFPAMLVIVANIIIYLIVALVYQDYAYSADPGRINVLFSNLSFLISSSLISLISCRELEVYARNEFLHNEIMINNQLKQVETSRLAAIGEMSAGVAHEINNPLSIVLSSAQAIEKRGLGQDINIDMIKSHTEKIINAAKRITKIVNGLKILSRDGSRDDFKAEILESIVIEAVSLTQERLELAKIKLHIQPIPQVRVFCRSTQIIQVIVNLINNAYDAIEKYEQSEIKMSFIADKNFLFISVKDSGPEIPREIKDKMMLPFFTTKPVGKGTGLSLSLSKQMIEEHKGEFYLEDGKETVFTFSIPLAYSL